MRKRQLLLWLNLTLLAILWCGVLPYLAQQPSLRAAIERQYQRGINPTALYYTDLDAMSDIRTHLQRVRAEHPHAFWRLSQQERPEGPSHPQ